MIKQKIENNSQGSRVLGRAFNHLEDLVFFYGSAGANEALEHLTDFTTVEGSSSIRMKWDGNPQVYWGRETVSGPLILASHNSWLRGFKTSDPFELEDFILNQSGSPKTDIERKQRADFAKKFASLYQWFDAATPTDFIGFVYGDCLYIDKPTACNDVYMFSPNPKTATEYHVNTDSTLGKRIESSTVFVVGHAYFKQFGMKDHEQVAISNFDMFNSTKDLIVLGPVYNDQKLAIDQHRVSLIQKYVAEHREYIDGFLSPTKGLADLKNIVYRYVNQSAKAKELDLISANHFFNWLEMSSVSKPKQEKIKVLNQTYTDALTYIFKTVKLIQYIKDDVIDQLEQNHCNDIWDVNGEGRVRYADSTKQFGNIKLVPRKRWIPQ